jgi:hypothetical protein
MYFSTSQKLQVVLGAAATTTELPVTAHYREFTNNANGNAAKTEVPASQYTTTTGATAADVVGAPASNQFRVLDKLTVHNVDTVAATVTVQISNGGTAYKLFTRLVPVGQALIYDNGLVTVVGDASTTGRIVTLSAQGTKYDTFTTAKSMLPAAAIPTLPANFWQVGKQMRIRGVAGLSNIVTTPGTLTLQVMVGSVIAFTSGALQLNATAHTLLPFFFDILMTCRAIGASTTAKFQGNGTVSGIHPTLTAAQTDAANTGGIFSIPATAPALGTGFDSTAAQAIDLWAGFSISNSGNAFQIEQYTVDII